MSNESEKVSEKNTHSSQVSGHALKEFERNKRLRLRFRLCLFLLMVPLVTTSSQLTSPTFAIVLQ